LTLGTIGNVFQWLGKWTIAISSTFIGYIIITQSKKWKYDIHSPIFPSIVFLLCAYLVACLFMNVYGVACDCILQCFLVDEELGKKSSRPPAHSPQMLLDFMERERDGSGEDGQKGNNKKRCCVCC